MQRFIRPRALGLLVFLACATTRAQTTTTSRPTDVLDDPLAAAASGGDVEEVFRRLAAAADRATKEQLNVALLASLRDAPDGYRGRGHPSPFIDGDDLPEPAGLDVERQLAEVTRLLVAAGADATQPATRRG